MPLLRQGAVVMLADLADDAGARAAVTCTADGGNGALSSRRRDLPRGCDATSCQATVARLGRPGHRRQQRRHCGRADGRAEHGRGLGPGHGRQRALDLSHHQVCAAASAPGGGGSILNVASVSSFVAQQGTPAYCASKGAVLMLTKSLALDYGPRPHSRQLHLPGHHRHAHAALPRAPRPATPTRTCASGCDRVPTGEMLYPEDMGRAAAFLCSDDAAGITGASLVVDGGYIAAPSSTHRAKQR